MIDPAKIDLAIRSYQVSVAAEILADGRRRFIHQSTQGQIDGQPLTREYADALNGPRLNSSSLLIDALFAMTLSEVEEATVDSIQDPAFNNGKPIPCACFETGELWRYVWTRDSAYSVGLGLGWLDVRRSLGSLLFKVSKPRLKTEQARLGEAREIIQDTGTGGSWPVSTDRVVWAFGAKKLLPFLAAEQRQEFVSLALEALVNTLETDRLAVFDHKDGLYRGEQSFLDWREQSYASWTKDNALAIGMAKALSTNVLHYAAMRLAAELASAEQEPQMATRYQQWATQLKAAIQKVFWNEQVGQFRAMTSAGPHAFSLEKYDLLGQSLAVLCEIAIPSQASRIFSGYPFSQAGPPVIHPQQPDTAIYHNRAIWPFVTALAMLAAKQVGHSAFVTASFDSLVECAALNLSNMENFEWLTGLPYYSEAELSGPVVNSRRQLWSVAAFFAALSEQIIGLHLQAEHLYLQPGLTHGIARRWFPQGHLRLENLALHGRKLSFILHWDAVAVPEAFDGVMQLKQLFHRGQPHNGAIFRLDDLRNGDEIRLVLQPQELASKTNIKRLFLTDPAALSAAQRQQVFAPRDPILSWQQDDADGGRIVIDRREDQAATSWDLYRNGMLIASEITASSWSLLAGQGPATNKSLVCYQAVQMFISSGNRSHPSPSLCLASASIEWTVDKGLLRSADGASIRQEHGCWHFNDWGFAGQVLLVADIKVDHDGDYLFDLSYGNAFGPISSGITAAVKELRVIDQLNGAEQSVVLWMPHLPTWKHWRRSAAALVALQENRNYRLELRDFKNMSYYQHFANYTGGQGGRAGPINRCNISGLRLMLFESKTKRIDR